MRVTIKKAIRDKIKKDEADIIMIGKAVTNDRINTNDLFDKDDPDLRFSIKPLCEEPASFAYVNTADNNEYVIFGKRLKKIVEITQNEILNANAVEELKKYLESNLFIYRPYINFKEATSTSTGSGTINIEVHKNITESLTTIPISKYNPNAKYIRIPRLNMTLNEFASGIDRTSKVDINDYPVSLTPPRYILLDDYIVKLSEDTIQTKDVQGVRWFFGGDANKVFIHSLNPEDNAGIITTGFYISFIDNEILERMEFTSSLNEEIDHIKASMNIMNETLPESNKETDEEINELLPEPDSAEIIFIKGLCESCQREGLLYYVKDIMNFHISVKTNYLTILSGTTGTGKSQLAEKYAEFLCGTNRLMIPVETSFLESDDVIGYLNISNGIYHASRTGLVDFLLEAGKHEDKMFCVIFDEMNLAQAEFWFAPFISLLEQKEKTLRLYNGFCMNGDRYPEKIKITNNVRFIGTINLDETVKEFSDRLLDRTNLVELHKHPFHDVLEIDTDPHFLEGTQPSSYSAATYQSWINNEVSKLLLTSEEVDMFEKLNEVIESHDHRKGISFRVLQCISNYLSNIPKAAAPQWTITREEAIDIQISQRIISKLKGTPQSLRGLISSDNEQMNTCPLLKFFVEENYKNISDFTKTKALINRKVKELRNYGYTY